MQLTNNLLLGLLGASAASAAARAHRHQHLPEYNPHAPWQKHYHPHYIGWNSTADSCDASGDD
ncbi:3920f7fe-33ed-44dc-aee1-b08b0066262a [Thermothielavioides terrestris]|nr:3920f7fe-33ed-44dc-aee1-b08b0066262a [Thermothielavioides terrestris]